MGKEWRTTDPVSRDRFMGYSSFGGGNSKVDIPIMGQWVL